ncbi:MAG: hypothetical protein K1X83_06960 [Oligoflexia bacterium]|nr:hypothetical protein [Oligoflexia bacterium]
MKKNRNLSNLSKASLALGAVAGLRLADAHAMQSFDYHMLGSGAVVRGELLEKAANPVYAAHEDAEDGEAGSGKTVEGNCGEGKEKSAEANCGEGKDKAKKEHEADQHKDKSKDAEGKCGEGKCGEEMDM